MQRCQLNRPKGDAAAEILGLGNEERPLKFGSSFTNPKATSFHTLKYDFKPASVDINKMATVDVGTNHQVTVTVPHLDGSGTEHTVFKGSQRPYQKECVLIIDHVTGEMKLEKLSGNIQVKKTRKENMKLGATGKPGQPGLPCLGDPIERLPGPPMRKTHTSTSRIPSGGSRQKSKPPAVASSKSGSIPHHTQHLPPSPTYLSPGHHQSPPGSSGSSLAIPAHQSSPMQAASLPSLIGLDNDLKSSSIPHHTQFVPPSPTYLFPGHHQSPPGSSGSSLAISAHQSSPMQAASLPSLIGLDDFSPAMDTQPKESPDHVQTSTRPVGSLSDSSSDSSSNSDSSSDSDSDDEPSNSQSSGHMTNGQQRSSPSICRPDHLLKEDLQLSESGSDSD